MERDATATIALADEDLEHVTAGKRHKKKMAGCPCGPSCRCGTRAAGVAGSTPTGCPVLTPVTAPDLGGCPGGVCKKG